VVLKTLAKPEILPPNSSRPAVGDINRLILRMFPGRKTLASVSKNKPLGHTFRVRPVYGRLVIAPTLWQAKSSCVSNRLYFRLSTLLLRPLP